MTTTSTNSQTVALDGVRITCPRCGGVGVYTDRRDCVQRVCSCEAGRRRAALNGADQEGRDGSHPDSD